MTKQLIALVGGLVCAAVFALGVMLGVVPLITGAAAALEQTSQADATNQTYKLQIDSLTAAKKNLHETEASVAALRGQIPAAPLLDQAFAIADTAATAAGAQVTSINRGDLTAFETRPAPPRANLVMEPPATPAADGAASTGTSDPAAAGGTASMGTADAPASSTAKSGTDAAKQADPASGRQQVRISIVATAPTMDAVQAFLDGLRDADRLLAIDKATVTEAAGEFSVTVEAITFLQTDGSAR